MAGRRYAVCGPLTGSSPTLSGEGHGRVEEEEPVGATVGGGQEGGAGRRGRRQEGRRQEAAGGGEEPGREPLGGRQEGRPRGHRCSPQGRRDAADPGEEVRKQVQVSRTALREVPGGSPRRPAAAQPKWSA